ncbi:MAG: glycoside hydrolase [Eubacterium sp.]
MKKLFSAFLSIVVVLVSCIVAPVGVNAETVETTIKLNEKYQTMKGFGASACWWSQDVGEWENAQSIMSLLYDKEIGIGLNIYRYNLGAGSKGDPAIYIANRSTESFINADGSYDWSKDANAQKCLEYARNAAGDDLRVTLFCNSAPVIYTVNGKAYCDAVDSDDAPWTSNLSSDNYVNFAEYCYNCAMHFTENGYRITDVSPINEPQYTWRGWYNSEGSVSMSQEGCYYSKTEARDLLIAFVDKFSGSELDKKGCKVSMFESGAIEGEDTTCSAYVDCIIGTGLKYLVKNEKLRNYFDSISMHSYWSGTEQKTNAADYYSKNYSKYDIAATEYCQMANDGNNGVYDIIQENGMSSGLTIEYGLAMANIIYDDLTILNVNEWDWWTACAYGGYTDGLVYLNPDNHLDVQTSKRLWCLGNFSKFTEEDSVRVSSQASSDSLKSVCFANPDGTVSVVYINSSANDVSTNIALSGYDKNITGYTSYVTDSTRDLQMYQNGATLDNITVPSNSVTTVVIRGEKPVLTNVTTTEPTTETATASTQPETTVTQPIVTEPTTTISPSQSLQTTTAPAVEDTTTTTPTTAKAAVKKPKSTSIKKLTKGKKSFKVAFKKVTGISGYQIQYSTDKKFKKGVKTASVKKDKTSLTVKKLKSNNKYYVRIRTYKSSKVNGKVTKTYSSWSKVKSVKVK